MNGWMVFAFAFFLLAFAGWMEATRQRWKHEQAIRERDEARAQRDKLNSKNAELCETAEKDVFLYRQLHDSVTHLLADKADLQMQLAEALKPKTRTVRAKKVEAQS